HLFEHFFELPARPGGALFRDRESLSLGSGPGGEPAFGGVRRRTPDGVGRAVQGDGGGGIRSRVRGRGSVDGEVLRSETGRRACASFRAGAGGSSDRLRGASCRES